MKTILNLKCDSCGGTYDTVYNIDGDNVFECPYCHTKQLVIESDVVKIAREKYAAYRDIEIEKIRQENGYLTEKERERILRTGKPVLIVLVILLVLILAHGFFT